MTDKVKEAKVSILMAIEAELHRFTKKIAWAIIEQESEGNFSSRHYAASKRGALDLKNELTKLTQDSKYIYSTQVKGNN